MSEINKTGKALSKVFKLTARATDSFKDNVSIAPSEVPSEFDTRKKIKYGKPAQAAWAIFSEYCNNSTIHGIRYLGEEKRPWLERLFWICVFVLSIYTCSRFTMNIWTKWDSSPVIVSFAEKSTPVWEIPFPAVTICPETKARPSVFSFTNVYLDLQTKHYVPEYELTSSPAEFEYMEAISQVCDSHLIQDFAFGHNFTRSGEILERIENATVKFNETFLGCKWRNQLGSCDELFVKVVTEEGICYTFNSFDESETYRLENTNPDGKFESNFRNKSNWSLEEGYDKNAGTETYPERVLGAGARAGLFMVVMGQQSDYDFICRGPVQGFKILLHTPGEVPQVSRQYFRIPFKQEVLVAIRPNMITTSDGLKDYLPHRRQCYFNKERYLRYFQVYTQANCELECLANFTLQACGCVKFSMPKSPDTPICGAAKIKCYDAAEDKLLESEFVEGLASSDAGSRGKTKCDCLPACTSVVYDAEISQADFNTEGMFTAFQDNDTVGEKSMARFSIFFKENQFLTSKRSELYGITDFIANCGGLLGLFMGVSTLSLVEILYFCTVRLCSNLKMRHERMQKIKQKKILKAGSQMQANVFPSIIINEPSYDAGQKDA